MLEEQYRKLGLKYDEVLQGFGCSDGVPGFWCHKAKRNDVISCIEDCRNHLSCGEKFAPIRATDHLEDARYDWGLMALTGQVRTPWGELDALDPVH